MESILKFIENMAKYGVIDVFFGIGIIQYIRVKLKKTTVTMIDGIDIVRRFQSDGNYEIEIKNSTNNPLYIYRVYFNPKYNKMIGTAWDWFIMSWVRDFPTISLRRGKPLNGEYMLDAYNDEGVHLTTVFLENRQKVFYRLSLENGSQIVVNEKDSLHKMLDESRCGTLTLHCVHGVNQLTLSTRV